MRPRGTPSPRALALALLAAFMCTLALVGGYRAWIPVTALRLHREISAVRQVDAGDPSVEQVPLLLDRRFFVWRPRLTSLALWGPDTPIVALQADRSYARILDLPAPLCELIPGIVGGTALFAGCFAATMILFRRRVLAALRRLGVPESARRQGLHAALARFQRALVLPPFVAFLAGIACSLPPYLLQPERADQWHVFPGAASLCVATGVISVLLLCFASRAARRAMSRAANHPMLECTGCGYDVSAPGSSRCPECGRDLQQSPPAIAWILLPHRAARRARRVVLVVGIIVLAAAGASIAVPSIRIAAADALLARGPRQQLLYVQSLLRPGLPVRVRMRDAEFLIQHHAVASGLGRISISKTAPDGTPRSTVVWDLDAAPPAEFAIPGMPKRFRLQLGDGSSISSGPTQPGPFLAFTPAEALISYRFADRSAIERPGDGL